MITCQKCGVPKPATREHFKTRSNGKLEGTCRDCWKAYMKAYYARNREAMLERVRTARAADPDFHRERDKRYFLKNRDAKRETKKRQWAKTDKAAAGAKLREWKAANPDKVRKAGLRRNERIRSDPELRAKASLRVREWARENPEAAAAQRARRRARELGAEGEYTRQHVHAILRLQGRACYYCEGALARFDVDHFIPLSRGGSNDPGNIVVCCDSCNSSKGAKLPWEWRPERFSEGASPR